MKKAIIAALLLGSFAPSWARTEAEIDSCVNSLLSQMTLQEKVGQLNQLSSRGLNADMFGMIAGGQVGSILNEITPEAVNRLQKEAVENSRLHIPLIFARDVIHGFKTMFPIPLGQAASWNPAVVEEGARIAADEASSVGVRWTFSPMLDVSRDARWGRCAESFGEDPYLIACLGQAMIKGYQGEDISKPNTMASCAKHFVGYGAAESGIDYNTTWIPDPLLREVYLPPFKAAVDAKAATFMCSFNDVNGVPPSGNRRLLNDVLRDQWNFDGVLVSDWSSIGMMVTAGYTADLAQAAEKAVDAGVDIDMESYAYISQLENLVNSGKVSMDRVDALVGNVLRLKYRLGLFDNPYVDESNSRRFFSDASLDAARVAAEEGAILFKNSGVLPLGTAKGKKIAVIGPMADAQHDQNGTWCFDLEKEKSVTPLTSLRQMYGEKNIIYAPGLAYSRDRSTAGFKEAVKAAKAADVVLYFAGEEAVLSGEGHSRADLTLPGAQAQLLDQLKAAGKPVVVIVQAGRPLALTNEAEKADALVFCFHAGTMAGPALANLLSGNVNFSGRVPMTFPRLSGQVPVYYSAKPTGRPFNGSELLIDDIPLEASQTSTGCTSYYLDAGNTPLYPFGYGLSYTTFEYSAPKVSASSIAADQSVTVTCNVTNTGKTEGQEVAQLYIRAHVGSMVRPLRQLRGFQKISLKPGETREVAFTLTPADLAYETAEGKVEVEPGNFSVWIAPNSAEGEAAKFVVTEKPNEFAQN